MKYVNVSKEQIKDLTTLNDRKHPMHILCYELDLK